MEVGRLRKAKASRGGPQISHLLFVDNNIIFGEALTICALGVKDILHEYEECSGQCVNFENL